MFCSVDSEQGLVSALFSVLRFSPPVNVQACALGYLLSGSPAWVVEHGLVKALISSPPFDRQATEFSFPACVEMNVRFLVCQTCVFPSLQV